MEQKNRTILVIAIAITVFAAVFVSFGLPSLTGQIPKVVLPDGSQEGSRTGESVLPVEVTPETVQSVIATLSRPENYERELAVSLFWSSNGRSSSSMEQVKIWADDGWIKTEVTSATGVEYRLVGKGTLYLWYAGEKTWKKMAAADGTADLAQRIPTYEDVLNLQTEQITDAGYERKNGKDCIYVAVKDESLNCLDQYWIETATGLLCAAETQENGKTVYEMAETSLQTPKTQAVSFALPDGTVLHESSVSVQQEDGSQG